MISEIEAKKIILATCNPNKTGDEWIITECFSSPKNDFWVIRGNTRLYVEEKNYQFQLAGVNAYLVNKKDGAIHIVVSAQSVDEFLEDYYDEIERGGKVYVLSCGKPGDKRETIKIRQLINSNISEAHSLFNENKQWVTGKKRYLEGLKAFFQDKGISTEIELIEKDESLPVIERHHIFHSDFIKLIKERIRLSTGTNIIQPEREK